jgi:hypothetical protein
MGCLLGTVAHAQTPGAAADSSAGTAPSARAQEPFDLSGYWTSIVTQDWRYRMVVPGPGEYAGIPISLIGKQFADAWSRTADEAAGKQCEAYGAPSIMRVPEQLHVIWLDENTLEVQTDAGKQTRVLHFGPPPTTTLPASLQGYSLARWQIAASPLQGQTFGTTTNTTAVPRFGSLKVTTRDLLAGLLRKNGVAYSSQTSMTEYWEMHPAPDGADYLMVVTEVDDPVYLRRPYTPNPIFKREPDGSKWNPTPCSLATTP